jgi:hypothetical protein
MTLSQTGFVDPVTGQPFAGDQTIQSYANSSVPALAVIAGGDDIYLLQAFYTQSPANQAVTLVHELLHLTFGGATDAQIASLYGLAVPAGLTGDALVTAASQAISGWLSKDCNK